MTIRIAGLFAAALALASCTTPLVQSPLTPPAGFAGPRIKDAASPGMTGAFIVQDGARLPFLHWAPADGKPWATIVALHGMNDHDASFRLAGPWWAEHGIEVWSFDQRGFGQAPAEGIWAGEALLTEDLRTVTALVRARRPDATLAVVGESMGGSVAAAAFGGPNPPDADRVVLLSPGVWGWSSQNILNRTSLWIASHTVGDLSVEPPDFIARHILASDNIVELIRNGRDPDTLLSTRFDAISGLVDLMESASNRIGLIKAPVILMYGAHDQVVEPGPMRRALERAGTPPSLRTAFYDDGWHLLNRNLGAERMYRDVEAYLRDASAPLPSGVPPVLPELQKGRLTKVR
ncbi:MAG TPA: alpha/beta fold hydrolase [Brevundimonas sp.]|jgi:alpha-beta hydrolase superfamily lysophospholipase